MKAVGSKKKACHGCEVWTRLHYTHADNTHPNINNNWKIQRPMTIFLIWSKALRTHVSTAMLQCDQSCLLVFKLFVCSARFHCQSEQRVLSTPIIQYIPQRRIVGVLNTNPGHLYSIEWIGDRAKLSVNAIQTHNKHA